MSEDVGAQKSRLLENSVMKDIVFKLDSIIEKFSFDVFFHAIERYTRIKSVNASDCRKKIAWPYCGY